MDQPYNRISENVLFTLLLTALVGWLTAPVASDLLSASAGFVPRREGHHAEAAMCTSMHLAGAGEYSLARQYPTV